jgi:hypothetical protein
MSAPLIWLHEEALRATHPVFEAAPEGTKCIFIWDDEYLTKANYSLKRLVFIYEALCELPVDIIKGQTVPLIKQLEPSKLYVPTTNNPLLLETVKSLASVVSLESVPDEVFVPKDKSKTSSRFFQYWKQAQKTAFLKGGG